MKSSPDNKKAIIVLGMHRSGTSVIARSLEVCGVSLGDKLIPGLTDNKKGFFEDAEVNALNEGFLAEIGGTWCSAFLPSADEAIISRYVEKNLSALRSRFSGIKYWALKEPRITRLPFLWERIFQSLDCEIKYILANRHPFSVADSLKQRNDLPRQHALVLWMIHQSLGMTTLLEHGGIVVDYDNFLENPAHDLDRISLHIGSKKINPEEFISSFLEKSLRHNKYTSFDESDFSDPTEVLAMRLYGFLRTTAQTGCALDPARVHALQDELSSHLQQHKSWIMALDQIAAAHIQLQSRHQKLKTEHESAVQTNNKLRSELNWLENHQLVKKLRALKQFVSKSK